MKPNGKVISIEEAISHIKDGDRVMIGGFGDPGTPNELVDEIIRQGQKDLTVIATNLNRPNLGIGQLFSQGRMKALIGTHFNGNREVCKAFDEGRLPITLLPMGTLCEMIRAGGAGIPAMYLPASAGTELAAGKETRVFNGVEYVLEHAITADIALIKAYRADKLGNLQYRKSARNYNPLMATAAKYTIVLAEEVVEVGEIDPDMVMTPHVYVNAIVRATK